MPLQNVSEEGGGMVTQCDSCTTGLPVVGIVPIRIPSQELWMRPPLVMKLKLLRVPPLLMVQAMITLEGTEVQRLKSEVTCQ